MDALEAKGARGYDAPACDCVRALLTRAEELGGGVGAILVARAESHLSSLSARFDRDTARVRERLEHVQTDPDTAERLQNLLQRGDVVRVARTLRRIAVQPVSRPQATSYETVASPAPKPDSLPPPRGRNSQLPPRSLRKQRAVVYEDSVAALVASFALARATDVVPEDAGPYNPLRIASNTLDRMREVSPFFLTVQLNRLEELASLLALPELPAPPEEKALPRKKTKALKGGRTS
ncbi:MAG: DUF2894 domain-containing protein [Myxococcales bacterium]